MISTLDDMRVWTRDLALGKLLSPAMKKERDRFLPAPPEGDGALYGLALENQNGWIGQYLELYGLPLLPAGRGHHDGGALEFGRRYPGVVGDDARHHPDHQPEPSLARPAKGVVARVWALSPRSPCGMSDASELLARLRLIA